ncbi:MAG TPA: transcriptional regulator MntR [Bacillota bacterium]|jgi:Mn-dependent DtxR family transcriptional regulator|nr:transcriptional regulator MntR [Bacillota bacterium]
MDVMLTESMEDYLEMFYRIVERQGYIRSSDLSAAIKVKPSSVTRMLQKLHEAGFIAYEKYKNISLTQKGLTYGRFLVWRDETLKHFLQLFETQIGIEEQVEGIEHYITPQCMRVFQNLIFYFKEDPKRLADLAKFGNQRMYPEGEDLKKLRAWLFRHGTE